MKTKITFIALFAFFISHGFVFSQSTVTSINNGNWYDISTWDCACIPLPADSVIINHDVTLDTTLYMTGTLTINANASLSRDTGKRGFIIDNGTLLNSGLFNFDNVSALNNSNITNNDTMNINSWLYNDATINNHAVIHQLDSFYNTGNFQNSINGSITVTNCTSTDTMDNAGVFNATNFTNTGYIYNNGTLELTNFTNTGSALNQNVINTNDITNTGTFINESSINSTHDFRNTGNFTNAAHGFIQVMNDFQNADTLAFDAMFLNNGAVEVGNNWQNVDTIKGSGRFAVQDSTANHGYMLENFDFCDSTPVASPPYIDLNTGSISASITYCQATGINAQRLAVQDVINIFPNPFSGKATLFIQHDKPVDLTIYDITGKIVKSITNIVDPKTIIDMEGVPGGFYLVKCISNQTIIATKIIVAE